MTPPGACPLPERAHRNLVKYFHNSISRETYGRPIFATEKLKSNF